VKENAAKATAARIANSARFNFMKFVKKVPSGCWEWTMTKRGEGYGNIWNGERNEAAHRFSYRKFIGEVPDGLNVCHKCDNRKCVNPDHLYAATQSQNLMDMVARGRNDTRAKTWGEKHNKAKLTAKDVRRIRKLYSWRSVGIYELGEMFGVSGQNIYHIIHGKTWKHIL